MLCSVIKGPTYEEVSEQLNYSMGKCSIAELRLDFFESINIEQLKALRKKFSIPMIFTLRSRSQGGVYSGTEEERISQIMKLSLLKPEYIDLEYTVPHSFAKELKTQNPETKIIISYHDFEKMPSLITILKKMHSPYANLYKMAFTLHSSAEALSLLNFMKDHAANVVAMGMGPYGESTRILGPIFGARFVYANIDQESMTAPGQIPVKILSDVYHHGKLKPTTTVYGLIGDPVSKSLSHFAHNATMHALKLPSVYNKFPVPQNHLEEFLSLAKESGLRGLSVTMPLKEKVIPFIDEIDPWAKKIGAVNTLRFENGRITGFNTDGKGALNAIEEKMKVKGKRMVFIGAGGAAKAIIAEAMDRGAQVTVLNRDEKRALELAKILNCKGGSLEQISDAFNENYDILINTTPSPMPIESKWILPHTVVMDIKTQPQNTEFMKEAHAKGCTLVYGYEMFVYQAIEQFKIWFGDDIDLMKVKETIKEQVLKNIQKD